MIDRIGQLESRLAYVELALRDAERRLDSGKKSRRAVWGWRALAAATLATALTGITIASASPGLSSQAVKAPFKVVDGSGVVMNVTSAGIQLRGPIRVNERSGAAIMYLGSDGHLSVGHGSSASVTLTSSPSGGEIAVFKKSGAVVEQMGSDAGGRGYFQILRGAGSPAVKLADYSHGGYFALTNGSSTARVEAGVTSADLGVVRAFGPGGFSFILGKR